MRHTSTCEGLNDPDHGIATMPGEQVCGGECLEDAPAHCYSDHNEDIRTKGSCDYCRSATPDR